MGIFLRAGGAAAVLALAGVAGGCGPEKTQLPPVPVDLQATAAEYDQPTGTVPQQAMDALADLQQKLDALSQSRLVDVVGEGLAAMRRRLADSGIAFDPATAPKSHRPDVEALLRIDRTCRGWDESKTMPDVADGKVELFAEIQTSRLERTVWGTANACKGRVDVAGAATVHAYLDGTIGIFLAGAIPENAGQAQYFLSWDGTIGTQAATANLTFDFRIIPPQLEVRIPVADGSIIGAAGDDVISLRGRNGTFGCSRLTGTCGPIDVVHMTASLELEREPR